MAENSGRPPATEGGIVHLADQLVVLLGNVPTGVDGPEAKSVVNALTAGGLPAVAIDGNTAVDVVVTLGEADGSSIDTARSYIARLTSLARVAIVFTPRIDDTRSTQWWDDLFASLRFEAADVLRAPLWDDAAWDAHGLTGLTLYVRHTQQAVLEGRRSSLIPRSAQHPGVLATARRVEVNARRLVDRLDLYDPTVDDPVETLRRALERSARDVQTRQGEFDEVAARLRQELDRLLADIRTLKEALEWEADKRIRAEEALARAEHESVLLRRELDDLVAAASASPVTTPSVVRQFLRRVVAAVSRRLQRRALQAADRLSATIPGRAGLYTQRAVAVYRSMTTDWLEATRELFDTDHYLLQRPGLIGSGIDPVVHYAQVGWRQGLDPHPLFDTDWYLRTNASVMAAGICPLEHFVSQGWREGCDPHPLFDTDFYVRRAVHLAVDGDNPLAHYLRKGWREGLDPHAMFETRRYLDHHPEVAASEQCPLVHYVTSGWQLGYQPGVRFDPNWYVEHHPEARSSGLPPYRYYLEVGLRRGDRPSP